MGKKRFRHSVTNSDKVSGSRKRSRKIPETGTCILAWRKVSTLAHMIIPIKPGWITYRRKESFAMLHDPALRKAGIMSGSTHAAQIPLNVTSFKRIRSIPSVPGIGSSISHVPAMDNASQRNGMVLRSILKDSGFTG